MSRKLYIFLTNGMGGCSGGVVYVRNKLIWLKEQGWDVVVYDSGGQYPETIIFPELDFFNNNHIFELYYPPCYFTKKRIESVIQKIVCNVNDFDYTVIESNTIELSEWGELAAKRIKAKHLIYVIQENLIIYSKKQYEYLRYKGENNELFSINPLAYKLLFSHFQEIKDPEDHYWQACNASPILDIKNEVIDSLPSSDFTISHFGRKKDYFNYMINQLCSFSKRHADKNINVLLLGVEYFQEEEFNIPNNMKVFVLGRINPIPKSFYDVSDIVIATSGCASMSFRYGAKVISMDTSRDIPLGVMGYTTIDRAFRSEDNHNNKELMEVLEEIFFEGKFQGAPLLELPAPQKTYDYQLKFANMVPAPYYDTLLIDMPQSSREYRDFLLLKFGLIKVRTKLRYMAFRKSI